MYPTYLLPSFSFSRNVKRMSRTVRVETESPLRRAVRLVERVARTRDSHIFAEGVEFRIRQKWILVCAFAGALLLFWMIYRGRRKMMRVEKVKLV